MSLSSRAMLHVLLLGVVFCQELELYCSERINGIQTFRIIQFTDCHFGEDQVKDEKSVESLKDLLNHESPDYIAITGDFISGYAWNGTQGWFVDHFNFGITPIIESSLPWSYVLGNHDDQADLNRTQIIKHAMALPNTYTINNKINDGVSNYVVTIKNRKTNAAVANIWYLDSLDKNCYNVTGWGCVQFEVVAWYKTTSINLEKKYGKKLPGIMYIHIPLPEVLNLWNNNNVYGHLEDGDVCCWALNTGLFSVIKERNDITQIWHGHDHGNDFYGVYHDVVLGFGRKTAYGGYQPPKNILKGARVVEFDCDGDVTVGNFKWSTWIRENDGTKVVNQPLHKPANWTQYKICCGSTGAVNRNLLQDKQWTQWVDEAH